MEYDGMLSNLIQFVQFVSTLIQTTRGTQELLSDSQQISASKDIKSTYVILRASAGLFVSAVSQCHSLCLCLSSKDIP